MAELAENSPVYSLLSYVIFLLQISEPQCLSVWLQEREKNGNFVVLSSDLYLFGLNLFIQYKGQKNPIYLHCQPWMEGEEVTKPGKSSVLFGQSWCDVIGLGSHLFGQTLMESCANLKSQGADFQRVLHVICHITNVNAKKPTTSFKLHCISQ